MTYSLSYKGNVFFYVERGGKGPMLK